MTSCVVVPLTLTSPELQQQRGHPAAVWNLATNAVIDVFCEYEKTRVLNVDDRHWQYLAPRWYKWAFFTAVS